MQGLHSSADTLTDVFNYTIQDANGLQDTATLTVTIHGANDLPGAVADTGTMTEDTASATFDVLLNDAKDPDSTAANTIAIGPAAVTVTGPAGETFVNSDATASVVTVAGVQQVQVNLNTSNFQQLAAGEHATVTVHYTLTGDAGETSTANLVVTVNGVNDAPVANDDLVSATEKGGLNNAVAGVDPSGNVITGAGSAGAVADTDPDHGDTRTVVAFSTGPEGGSPVAGTLGNPLTGAHGQLTLSSTGAYTYTVTQTDPLVQGLHTVGRHADRRLQLHHPGRERATGHRDADRHHPRRQRSAGGGRRHRDHDRGYCFGDFRRAAQRRQGSQLRRRRTPSQSVRPPSPSPDRPERHS